MSAALLDSPRFCLTADIDWASEHSIGAFLELAESRGITPAVFATHRSGVLDEALDRGAVEIGVHPNFGPGSTHGATIPDVLAHVFGLYPGASTFRCHRMLDGTEIQQAMVERGIAYDSNILLYRQPNLVPLRLATGLTRFPVFWSDDTQFRFDEGGWDLDALLPEFLTPGLKVIDVHPTTLAVNARVLADYEAVRPYTTTLDAELASSLRIDGEGAATFLAALLDHLVENGHRFWTLRELFEDSRGPEARAHPDAGRTTTHTRGEFEAYWSMSDAERQAFLRASYAQRDPGDPYATSRDVNLRDLEIEAIAYAVEPAAARDVLDLGCGNGLTLIRLAERFPELELVGVDFTEALVDGARHLAGQLPDGVRQPAFVCADVFEHLSAVPDRSVSRVLTERFVMNLPSQDEQRRLLTEVERVLADDGRLLMCEASEPAFTALNDVRDSVGLERIPARSEDNISVIRFEDDELEAWMRDALGLACAQKLGFSQFFLVARVVHPALIAPRQPRFDAPINRIARQLQEAVGFEPGYGANTMWVFERRG